MVDEIEKKNQETIDIAEEIRNGLFLDRNAELDFQFKEWKKDRNIFVITKNGVDYSVTVSEDQSSNNRKRYIEDMNAYLDVFTAEESYPREQILTTKIKWKGRSSSNKEGSNEKNRITVLYDYQDISKSLPLNLSNLIDVFRDLSDDAGMIVKVKEKEYYYESMEDFHDGILTCRNEDDSFTRADRITHLAALNKYVN